MGGLSDCVSAPYSKASLISPCSCRGRGIRDQERVHTDAPGGPALPLGGGPAQRRQQTLLFLLQQPPALQGQGFFLPPSGSGTRPKPTLLNSQNVEHRNFETVLKCSEFNISCSRMKHKYIHTHTHTHTHTLLWLTQAYCMETMPSSGFMGGWIQWVGGYHHCFSSSCLFLLLKSRSRNGWRGSFGSRSQDFRETSYFSHRYSD